MNGRAEVTTTLPFSIFLERKGRGHHDFALLNFWNGRAEVTTTLPFSIFGTEGTFDPQQDSQQDSHYLL
jgi:hypothetical protein